MSFAPGIHGVAIFEENTPQTFILNGQDVGTESPDRSPITRNTGRGTLKKIAENFEWTMPYDNESIHTSLDGASYDTLQWKMVVWTFNGVLFVLDEATFTPEETPQFDPQSEDYPYQLQYQLNGGQYIAQGIDLINAYRRSQNQSALANGTLNVTETIPFPFEGATVTLSNGATSITVEALDSSGTSLATSTTSTGTGRVSAELTLPANTQSVKVTIDDVQDPALRVDGKTVDPNA